MSDHTLELPPLDSLIPLDRPFTRQQVREAGVPRAQLERLLSGGRLRRLLRGVYGDASVEPDLGYRAEAVRLALVEGAVAAGRTAAWVWGVDVQAFAPQQPVPLERQRSRTVDGGSRHVAQVGELRLTTPLRTAVDLGLSDSPGVALAAMDRLVRRGRLRHAELLAELACHRGPTAARLRGLAAQVDGRALAPAESVLRLHWHASQLPTPVPALVVPARDGAVRFSLALPERRFGVLLGSQRGGRGAALHDLAWLRDMGWWVVTLPDHRVLCGEPSLWCRHLEREWHQQLLAEVG